MDILKFKRDQYDANNNNTCVGMDRTCKFGCIFGKNRVIGFDCDYQAGNRIPGQNFRLDTRYPGSDIRLNIRSIPDYKCIMNI